MKIFFLVVAILASIAATVLAFIFIIPQKKRANLNKIGKFAHDFLNFKFLIIEKILQALYVLCTAFSVVFGFFMLFFFEQGHTYYSYSGYAYHTRARWYGGWGLLLMIVGPIAIRLVYEGFMMAIILVKNVIPKHMEAISAKLLEMGCEVVEFDEAIRVVAKPRQNHMNFKTLPYPGFPTDAQAPVMAMATLAKGTTVFVETVFENRYKHVGEFLRLGARVKAEGRVAVVEGVDELFSSSLCAKDLRGSAALVVAALGAQGVSRLDTTRYLERGYEDFDVQLRALGADVKKI